MTVEQPDPAESSKPAEPVSAAEFRKKAHAWLNRAQADVEFALGEGAAHYERSTFGAMVARVELYAFAKETRDGTDKPVRIPRRTDGQLKITHQHEPAADVDMRTMARIGRGRKLLDLVNKVSPLARKVLVAYHGDRGARFGREMRHDGAGGVGNRDVAVYPLTEAGAKWILTLREESRKDGAAHLVDVLQPDEMLANQYAMGKRSRDDARATKLSKCAVEARAMIAYAHEVLDAAAQYQEGVAKQIRQTNLAQHVRETTAPVQREGTRVLMRSASGTVMHGPMGRVNAAEWSDLAARGALAEVIA